LFLKTFLPTGIVFVALAYPVTALAQPAASVSPKAESADVLSHPWQVPPPRYKSEAYFTNLQDGATIETPFRATFGLAGGWGLAPIAKPLGGKTGHHHLLLDTELPLDFENPLPFSSKYIHFGKGQMETVLTLEPGTYSLRLLLANSKHVLHLIYSKPIKVTVTRKNKDVDPNSLVTKGIKLLNIAADARLKSPFRLQFHASGLNVGNLSQQEKDTGHFRLTMGQLGGSKPVEINFVHGQTETWLAPPQGAYVLKLDFVDNANSAKLLADSVSTLVRVE
jgi:Domain of unknown function (DUF4399)